MVRFGVFTHISFPATSFTMPINPFVVSLSMLNSPFSGSTLINMGRSPHLRIRSLSMRAVLMIASIELVGLAISFGTDVVDVEMKERLTGY